MKNIEDLKRLVRKEIRNIVKEQVDPDAAETQDEAELYEEQNKANQQLYQIAKEFVESMSGPHLKNKDKLIEDLYDDLEEQIEMTARKIKEIWDKESKEFEKQQRKKKSKMNIPSYAK